MCGFFRKRHLLIFEIKSQKENPQPPFTKRDILLSIWTTVYFISFRYQARGLYHIKSIKNALSFSVFNEASNHVPVRSLSSAIEGMSASLKVAPTAH